MSTKRATAIVNILSENINNDTCFFVTKCFPNETSFAFDFFIFKPKLLSKNIFIDNLYNFNTSPETYLHDMIKHHNIKYQVIKRYNSDNWHPRRIDENLKLYHEHDMSKVIKLLKDKKLL